MTNSRIVWCIAEEKSYTVMAVIAFATKIGVSMESSAGIIKVKNIKKIIKGLTFDSL